MVLVFIVPVTVNPDGVIAAPASPPSPVFDVSPPEVPHSPPEAPVSQLEPVPPGVIVPTNPLQPPNAEPPLPNAPASEPD